MTFARKEMPSFSIKGWLPTYRLRAKCCEAKQECGNCAMANGDIVSGRLCSNCTKRNDDVVYVELFLLVRVY